MSTRTVTGVNRQQWPDGVGWVVDFVREDGVPWCYAFPALALWGRSAEYGIDPSDSATLLDVVIHESVMIDYGLSPDPSDPTFVHNTDAGSAWTAHQARIAQAKATVTHIDTGNHLQAIRDHHTASQHDPKYLDFHGQVRQTVASIRRRQQVA